MALNQGSIDDFKTSIVSYLISFSSDCLSRRDYSVAGFAADAALLSCNICNSGTSGEGARIRYPRVSHASKNISNYEVQVWLFNFHGHSARPTPRCWLDFLCVPGSTRYPNLGLFLARIGGRLQLTLFCDTLCIASEGHNKSLRLFP